MTTAAGQLYERDIFVLASNPLPVTAWEFYHKGQIVAQDSTEEQEPPTSRIDRVMTYGAQRLRLCGYGPDNSWSIRFYNAGGDATGAEISRALIAAHSR